MYAKYKKKFRQESNHYKELKRCSYSKNVDKTKGSTKCQSFTDLNT